MSCQQQRGPQLDGEDRSYVRRLVRKVEALPAGKAEEWGGTPHTVGAHGLGHGTRPSHLRAEGWPDNVGNPVRKVDVLPAGTVKTLDGSAHTGPARGDFFYIFCTRTLPTFP